VLPLGERRWIAPERWGELRDRAVGVLAAYHESEPLRAGMAREEWRSRLRLSGALAAEVVRRLRVAGAVEEREGLLALPGRGRSVTDTARAAADAIVATLEQHSVDPPGMADLRAAGLTPQLLRLLIDERRVVRLGPDVVMGAEAYARARAEVEAHLAEHGGATVAQLRDRLGATRRLVVPLLEHLDAARVTVRDGDLRRLRRRSGTPPGAAV